MKVITISEECHGFIGIAKDMPSVVDYLIKHHWLDTCTEVAVRCPSSQTVWIRVDQYFGGNWEEKVRKMSFETFTTVFDGTFYLDYQTVHEC